MDEETISQYLLGKAEATRDYPFGPEVSVFRVEGKMFALLSSDAEGLLRVNLKCDPDEANALRHLLPAVIPGYHMNKKHWNTVLLDGSIPPAELERMIDNSWFLVVKGLKKSSRDRLESKTGQKPSYRPF